MQFTSAFGWRHHPWFPPAAALTAMLLVSTVLLGGLGYEVADHLIHPPREVPNVDPMDRGVPFENVAFSATDGVGLVGWWMPASETIGTVVFLHGYGASKAQSLAVAPFLHAAGYSVLAFDFRAHGESGGTHTTVGLDEARDVIAAVAFLRTRADADLENLALFGWSMGAAASLNAARDLPEVRVIVADSAFARLDNVVQNSLPAFTGLPHQPFGTLGILFASWMVQRAVWENAPADAARALERPLLIIQGTMDDIARPDSDGAALYDAAGAFGELWLVPGATHVNARRADPAAYEAHVLGFLEQHLKAP